MRTALETRKAIQQLLASVKVDGRFGEAETWPALRALAGAPDGQEWPPASRAGVVTLDPSLSAEKVDARSEAAIATLHEKVRPLARQLVQDSAAAGITIKITSGSRTYAEQNDLYEQGRTKPGKIVTNARGGQSNHCFGIAFDVTIFNGSQPVWESPLYKTVGKLGKSLGFTWGGDWASINDEPHFELKPAWAASLSESSMLAALRSRHDAGKDVFA